MRAGRVAVFAIVLTGLLALPAPSPAAADPSPAELRKLTKQATQLNERYRGSIQSLEEIRIQAKRAVDNSGSLQRRLANARSDLAAMAENAYIHGPLDISRLFGSQVAPHKALGQAANMNHMVKEQASRVAGVQKLIKDAEKAKLQANGKIKSLEKEIKALQSRRRELDRLLAKYGFQQPGSATGLTQRTIDMRAEVMRNFPMPYGVGCLRPGDPGEHGKGRACDFMTSRGMASGNEAARGDALAAWLIRNGERLGVMYIIWKQRYYDMRSRRGWDPMSDRGGVTANHWDHVHVSMF